MLSYLQTADTQTWTVLLQQLQLVSTLVFRLLLIFQLMLQVGQISFLHLHDLSGNRWQETVVDSIALFRCGSIYRLAALSRYSIALVLYFGRLGLTLGGKYETIDVDILTLFL